MTPSRCFVALLVFGTYVGAQAQPVTVPSLGPRYKQTRERVEELFRYRNGNVPPPDPKLDLFRVVPYSGSPPPELPTPTKVEEKSLPDEVLLKLAVATIKAGTVTQGGRSYLIANKKRYEAGDFVVTVVRGKPVRLQLKYVAHNTATFAYGEAEMVASF